jgi:hypothetical protein
MEVMAGDSNVDRLAEIFSQCATEMLVDLGAEAIRIEGELRILPTAEIIAASGGFGNDDLRGSLALLGPSQLFSRLHPLPPTVTPRDLADWACEMVNQAVGRFRNRLAAYGAKVDFGVPHSALAELLRSDLEPVLSHTSFAIGGMVLECRLELETKPTFRLAERPLEEIEAALNEGTIILF